MRRNSEFWKWLKIVLFPAVVIVRKYRSISMRPTAVARRLYAYDCIRFARHAGGFHPEFRAASIARIIMAYHVLEKGLTMPHRHLDFGHSAVLNLIRLVEDFEKRFGVADAQVEHAIGCVKEYLEIHDLSNFDTSNDEAYWNRIKTFCSLHANVPSSKQIKITREQFFSYNDASFPVFARSRHTSRHYEGVVDIKRIKSAVELAMTAPSACNRQFVKVYCVSNHEIRDEIFKLQNGNRGFGSAADKLLVVTADLCGNRWAEERNDLYTNAGIFIMNLCYALHYNKIVHCILNWSVSPQNDVSGHDLLGIPENEAITAVLACGNAPDNFLVAASPRKKLTDIFKEI